MLAFVVHHRARAIVVIEVLGHSDIRLAQRYIHVASPAAEDAAARMGWRCGADSGLDATTTATRDVLGVLCGERTPRSTLEPPVGIEPTTCSLRVNRSAD
jgi:hypothetical protein